MGYPLYNNYTLFRALSEPVRFEGEVSHRDLEELRIERENLLRVLNQFNIFAFILHDPESHPEFDQYLNHVFEELDRDSRGKLLFFALVNPDEEWLERRRHRPFHIAVRRFEYCATELNYEVLPDSDPAASAYAIAWALNIPSDDLPVILITDDLSSPNFLHVSTSVNEIQSQLRELGEFALTFRRRSGDYRTELRRVPGFENVKSYESSSGLSPIKKSLAKTLGDIMSFINFAKRKHAKDEQLTLMHIESVIKELQAELHRSKYATGQLDAENINFDYYAVYLANLLSFLPGKRRRPVYDLGINPNLLEPESRRMLTTAINVREFLDEPKLLMPQMRVSDFDFSPSAICFANFFEREVNLSFVHWVRRYLGVRLPKYFDRFDPDITALYFPEYRDFKEPIPVNFNAGNYYSWRPPSLGQTQISLSSLSQKEAFFMNFHYISLENLRVLLNLWREFKNIRNSAAHPRIIESRDVQRMVNILTEMNELEVFSAMSEMKKKFSGR